MIHLYLLYAKNFKLQLKSTKTTLLKTWWINWSMCGRTTEEMNESSSGTLSTAFTAESLYQSCSVLLLRPLVSKVYENLGSWLKRCTWDRASFCEGSRQKAEEFLPSAPKKKHKSNIKPGLAVLQRNHLIDSFTHWFASLVVIFADSVTPV